MNFYFDLDGSLAEWREEAQDKDFYQTGYYISLKPNEGICNLANSMSKIFECYIVSAYVSETALGEKIAWVKKYLPDIPESNFIFVPYGQNKAKFVKMIIKREINKSDFLFDDYSKNLKEWEKGGGSGIKVINNVNGKGQKWHGPRIDAFEPGKATKIV